MAENGTERRMRPLRRLGPGYWRSRDGRWTFLRHESDPHPRRWFAYYRDDTFPLNGGMGHTRLGAAVEWVIDYGDDDA